MKLLNRVNVSGRFGLPRFGARLDRILVELVVVMGQSVTLEDLGDALARGVKNWRQELI